MSSLEKFRNADLRVSQIEATLKYNTDSYVPVMIVTSEYEQALQLAQNLYQELELKGINPY